MIEGSFESWPFAVPERSKTEVIVCGDWG